MSIKLPEVVITSLNLPVSIKFKGDLCDSSFKKKITLAKHKITKHSKNNSTSTSKTGEEQF